MSSWTLLVVVGWLAMSAPALAVEGASGAADPSLAPAAEPSAAPVSDDSPEWEGAAEPVPAEPVRSESEPSSPTAGLGPEAVDEHGHVGRIHTVVSGDTLWEVSTAYLGTPWVWPSIWQENDDISNPHLILPGDHIWISAGEMRKITREEADEMLAADEPIVEPAAPAWDPTEDEADLLADDVPAAMDPLSLPVPLAPNTDAETGRTVRVAEREAMGFVSGESIDAATSIVGSPSPRTWLADGDRIYLGMGEGRVSVGDEFTVFRDAEPVKDLDDGRLLGYHVDILGWAVVREVEGESSIAEIRMSHSEIERGDQVIPRLVPPPTVPIRATPDGIDGKIVFMPADRTQMGSSDHVYLNRGALHGFEVGSQVEVYTAGRLRRDKVSGQQVMTPDHVDARMVLVEVKPDTSVAYIVYAERELEIGDTVRATARQIVSR